MVLELSLALFQYYHHWTGGTMRRFQWRQVTHKIISSLNEPKFSSPATLSILTWQKNARPFGSRADITHLLLILWRNLIRTWSTRIMCHYEEWQKLWSSINMVLIDKRPLTGKESGDQLKKDENFTIECIMPCGSDKIFDGSTIVIKPKLFSFNGCIENDDWWFLRSRSIF